jgi:hypothetical protein
MRPSVLCLRTCARLRVDCGSAGRAGDPPRVFRWRTCVARYAADRMGAVGVVSGRKSACHRAAREKRHGGRLVGIPGGNSEARRQTRARIWPS